MAEVDVLVFLSLSDSYWVLLRSAVHYESIANELIRGSMQASYRGDALWVEWSNLLYNLL